MGMTGLFTWASVLLLTGSAIWYSRRIWKSVDAPVPATFILMFVVLGLSYIMYWDKPNASWTGNPGNLGGLVNVFIILVVLIARYWIDGTLAVSFNGLQKFCLAMGTVIVLVWLMTNDPFMGYLLMQGLALIAYTPTAERLIREKNPKDSNILWVSILIGALISILPTVSKRDWLGGIYLIRVIPSTALIVWLVWKKRPEVPA